MARIYPLAILTSLLPLAVFGQAERKDSLSVEFNNTVNIQLGTIATPDNMQPDSLAFSDRLTYNMAMEHPLSYKQSKTLYLYNTDNYLTPSQSKLLYWRNGGIIASGDITQYPGMMQTESGSISINQTFGKFTLNIGGTTNKYGYHGGISNQYGIDGNLTYQISQRLSFSLFGTYYFGQAPLMANGMPLPPSIIGYYNRSAFGATFDYRINDYWGVETGAQTIQQFGSGKYKVEPVVTPYYKINKKVKIGLPVGQMLYHILKRKH